MSLFKTIIISFFIIATSHTLWAQEVIIPIDNYPPWRIINEKGEYSGINIILTRILLEKMNMTPVFVERPWKRSLLMMKRGRADLMSGLLKRPEREKYMTYIEPPYKTKSSKAFYVQKGNSARIKKYEDLKGLSIGATLGSKYFERFDKDKTLKKDFVSKVTINFKKLALGRIDTFIATETVGDYLIKINGLGDKIEKADYVYEKPISVYFAVSKKSSLVKDIPQFSKVLQELIDSDEIQKTITKFTHIND